MGHYFNGYPFRPEDWAEDGLRILRIQNLTNASADYNRCAGRLPERYAVRQGDILISWSASLGVYRWPHEEPAWLNQHIFKVALDIGAVDPGYFVWLASWCMGELQKDAHGSTMQHLTWDRFGGFAVLLPPRAAQLAIAAFLDRKTAAIDQLIKKKERLIELLQEKRQALITQAVTKGLDPSVPMKDSGVDWIGPIPAGWQCQRLRDVAARVVVGIAQAATHAYADAGIPLVRSTNIRRDRILLDDLLYIEKWFADQLRSKYIYPGDLLTVRTGSAGVTAVVPPDLPISQCFTMLITSIRPGQSPHFFSLQLNSEVGAAYFKQESWGTAQENISVPILQNVPVAVPPASEQQEIVAELQLRTARLDEALAATERQIEALREYRQALISATVTGQIDVSNEAA